MLGLTTEQNSTTFPTHEETSHNSNKRERERERERVLMLHFGPLGSLSNISLTFE